MNSSHLSTRIVIAIPARFASTRFPGKPLAMLNEVPVIVHVVRAALRCEEKTLPIMVATDDNRIAQTVQQSFDASQVLVVMTDANCATGTDRLAQAITRHFGPVETWSERLVVLNVQGDEPFVNATHLDELARAMKLDETLQMATLAVPLSERAMIENPNIVKVVCARNGNALYFSRAPIPFNRDGTLPNTSLRHIGVYAYDAQWLLQMAQLEPTPLEEWEKLEQLRALENGATIRVLQVESTVDIAIDTPEDLEAARKYLQQSSRGD